MCGIQKNLVTRRGDWDPVVPYVPASELALQHEAPRVACNQGPVMGEAPPGLTMVGADRPRSHEGPAWVLAAIGVECSVSMAECRIDAESLMANSTSGMSDVQSAWRPSTKQWSTSAITALTRSVREFVL